jgi:hypothetical protein
MSLRFSNDDAGRAVQAHHWLTMAQVEHESIDSPDESVARSSADPRLVPLVPDTIRVVRAGWNRPSRQLSVDGLSPTFTGSSTAAAGASGQRLVDRRRRAAPK